MRLVEWLDAFLEHGPKKAVAALLGVVVVFVAVTGNAAPVMWYVQEKAAVVTEQLLPIFQSAVAQIVSDLGTPAPSKP